GRARGRQSPHSASTGSSTCSACATARRSTRYGSPGPRLAGVGLQRMARLFRRPPLTLRSVTLLVVLALGPLRAAAQDDVEVWRCDRLDRLGAQATTVQGPPRVAQSPLGPVVEFDGQEAALFVDVHPLAGARTFTWEAVFRPDGGSRAQ